MKVYQIKQAIRIEWKPREIPFGGGFVPDKSIINLTFSEARALEDALYDRINNNSFPTVLAAKIALHTDPDDYQHDIWVGADRFRYGGIVCQCDINEFYAILNSKLNKIPYSDDTAQDAMDEINREMGLV